MSLLLFPLLVRFMWNNNVYMVMILLMLILICCPMVMVDNLKVSHPQSVIILGYMFGEEVLVRNDVSE